MKKIIVPIIAGLTLFVTGAMTVFAAPQILFTDYNTRLNPGTGYNRTALQAEYNIAEVELEVGAVTSGTRKNTFMVSRYEGSKYVVKAVLVSNIAQYSCMTKNLGYVGHGTWMYSDLAHDPGTGEWFAGWSGTTIFKSQ